MAAHPGNGLGKQAGSFATHPFMVAALDFCLLNGAFFLVNWGKRGSFDLSPLYEKLLLAFWVLWLLVSLASGKFNIARHGSYRQGVWHIAKSAVYLTYCAAVTVVVLEWLKYSRTQVFGTCLLYGGLEWAAFSLAYIAFLGNRYKGSQADLPAWNLPDRLSIPLIIADFALVGVSFFLANFIHSGAFSFPPDYEKLLLLFYGLWAGTSFITGKFERRSGENFYHTLWPWLKAALLLFTTLALAIFLFRFTSFSNVQTFGPVLLLVLFEIILCGIYFIRKKEQASDIESLEERQRVLRQEGLPVGTNLEPLHRILLEPVKERLRNTVLKSHSGLYAFLDQTLDLSRIVRGETIVWDGADIPHWSVLDEHRMRLLINLHKVNDIRWINRYFLEAHNMLLNGGWLVVTAHTVQTHREWMFQKFPRILARIIFVLDFAWHRVAPKLPGGKLRNDFRATEWGRVMRRLWLDELPMLYNFIKGDLQLFGVRPLSAHYFSLYPKDLQELRMTVKPGLVPPYYADLPGNFDAICESERRYIEAYQKHPLKTQGKYFARALWNILIKGARSG